MKFLFFLVPDFRLKGTLLFSFIHSFQFGIKFTFLLIDNLKSLLNRTTIFASLFFFFLFTNSGMYGVWLNVKKTKREKKNKKKTTLGVNLFSTAQREICLKQFMARSYNAFMLHHIIFVFHFIFLFLFRCCCCCCCSSNMEYIVHNQIIYSEKRKMELLIEKKVCVWKTPE